MSAWEHIRVGKTALAVVLAAACLLPALGSSRADDLANAESTAKYFSRACGWRGLFKLAESNCLERLSHSGLSVDDRTDLTLELSRTLAEHADFVGSSEQDELWARSESALAELLKQEPENPRRLLVEVQRALLPAAIGHSRRLMAQLDPHDLSVRKRAAESLHAAVDALRAAESAIIARQRKTPVARPAASGAIRPFELRSLLGNVRSRLGGAILDLAHLQPAGSADQMALAMESQKVLKTVGESADDGDLIWQARTAFVECSRLLADYGKTLREVDALEKLDPPAEFADRLLAERVRVLIAQHEFRSAATLLADPERANRPVAGELQALSIELAIAEWRAANPASDAKVPRPVLKSLEAQAGKLRRDIGGYWALRGEQMIRQVQDAQQYGAELAELSAKAQAAFSSGDQTQAIELYGQATAQARRDGRAELAFHLGFTRSSVEVKLQKLGRRRHLRSAGTCRRISPRNPKNSAGAPPGGIRAGEGE